MKRHKNRIHLRLPPRALTLVEMIVSIVLVGVLMVAAINTVGAARLGQHKRDSQIGGHQLAQDLMAEILQQDYADPEAGADSFGLEADEVGDGSRALWEDVDDYDGWSASPPQYQDGTVMSDLTGWTRAVSVAWVSPGNIASAIGSNQGTKRITVTVSRDGSVVATLVAVCTLDPPPTEACCPGDGTCVDMVAATCTSLGGDPQGVDTDCRTTECPLGPKLLFVVTDDASPTAQELARQALIESWDNRVTLIADGALQSEFDAAVADADVAYVSEQIDAVTLGTKLRDAAIGIVIEEWTDDFGVALDWQGKDRDQVNVIANTHYITSPFNTGLLTYLSSLQNVTLINSGEAPGASTLAEVFNTGSQWKPALVVIDTGGELSGGGTASGRRVQLPWGGTGFDINALNADGQTIMQRSIEWAADVTGGGGGGTCGDIYVHDITMSVRINGAWHFGQATVWIKDDTGADVAGATVTVDWTGSDISTDQGDTGADGTIMLESGSNKNGGTFICTVIDVVKDGCNYNAALNVETSDTITSP